MKRFRSGWLILLALAVSATAAIGQVGSTSSRATVEGVVTKDPGSDPVKKVLIELIAENQAAGGDYTALTSADGSFKIEGIVPGRYRLLAERTGFVEMEKRHVSGGRLLVLTVGQELKDVAMRMQATAAVVGRITDEDGDAMANAQVAVMRKNFAGGHGRWEQVGAERTNDLGEYRIATLAAGNYYIAVTPPVDFKSIIDAASRAPAAEVHVCLGADCGAAKPPTSYMTTYYPGVHDRAQAATVQLQPGEDFPANFSLTPNPSVTIRGTVANVPTGATAAVMLRSDDFRPVLTGGEVRKDGSFEIPDVSPGSYTVLTTVTGTTPALMARQSLEVGEQSLSGLHMAPQPAGEVRGRLTVERKDATAPTKTDFSHFFLSLRSEDGDDDILNGLFIDGGFSNPAQISPDGSFRWKNVPPGRYYLVLTGDGETQDWFLKAGSSAGHDILDSGINVNSGQTWLDLTASNNGAFLDGVIVNHKGDSISNAAVVLVPEERLWTRNDQFHITISDQNGKFSLRGIPPGNYTLFAWEAMDGEQYYDPVFLRASVTQGKAVRLAERERRSVQLEAIPDSEDRQ